jgi:ATP-binding cassette subfamily B (MDR/TAP) protein 7
VQLASLRAAIGVVPQDTPLFHADIMHNVRYGRLDASDEEVVAAMKKAHVHDAVHQSSPTGTRRLSASAGLWCPGREAAARGSARFAERPADFVL